MYMPPNFRSVQLGNGVRAKPDFVIQEETHVISIVNDRQGSLVPVGGQWAMVLLDGELAGNYLAGCACIAVFSKMSARVLAAIRKVSFSGPET
jgi:hypothetical protein